jgi:hypothetical protein
MMRKAVVFIILGLFFGFSCKTAPEPVETPFAAVPEAPSAEAVPPPVAVPAAEEEAPPEVFNPAAITQELHDSTKQEVEAVIRQLNTINRNKDYRSWLTWLDEGYAGEIGNPAFLEIQSQSPRLVQQNTALKSLQDYFLYVFIPARQNARVDDIEFISPHKVRVITVTQRRQPVPADPEKLAQMEAEGWTLINGRMTQTTRERFYALEKTNDKWKIVNDVN